MSWIRQRMRLRGFSKYESGWDGVENTPPISPKAIEVANQISKGNISIFACSDGGLEMRLQRDVALIIEPSGKCYLVTGY